MQNYPRNSHIRFDMLGSYVTLEDQLSWLKSWNTNTLATYVLLKEGVAQSEVEERFPEFLDKHVGPASERSFELYLQPLQHIHLHSGHIRYQSFNFNQGSINDVYLFSTIAAFVLLIACINFMNLSTARSAKRAREVGLRKVVGSNRKQLITQFLGESIITTFLSLIVALALVQLVYPTFKTIFENRIIVDYYENWIFILELVGIALIVGVIAGSYPAFFLSGYQPVETLKGAFTSTAKGSVLRKALVLAQFAIAITLIISTGLIRDQMEFIRNKELGFNKDQVVYLPLRSSEVRDKVALLKHELKKHANIADVTASAGLGGASDSQGTMEIANSNGEVEMMMRYSYVDFDFVESMKMQIVQGRDFSRKFASDTLTSVIINEAAVKEIGWKNPIGKEFVRSGDAPNYSVVGVVKDYHFYSLRQKIEPLIMMVNPDRFRFLLIKVSPHGVGDTIADIESIWNKYVPGRPFEYDFLDEHFREIYRSDENAARLFASFAFIAIFIACLGLLGLASFTTEQKTKEIGIRKVLGASVTGLVLLLSREFTKWVAVASVIAFPVAYLVMQDWLENFVYRTQVDIITFISAAILVILIALATVSFQAIKAALSNPVDALRYE